MRNKNRLIISIIEGIIIGLEILFIVINFSDFSLTVKSFTIVMQCILVLMWVSR